MMAVERKLISENKRRLLMTEFLHREAARAGFGGCDIQRTPMGLRIRLVAERPGFVIGRRGSTIQRITRELKEKFDLENPQIEVEEAENPDLNPQIAAQKMAEALERGWHFRRAGHSTVRRIMDSGAKGVQIILTGKLTGSRGRMEKFTSGHIKHCGEPADQFMKRGYAVAKKKLGTIGVKINVMDPEAKLPDDITVVASGDVPDRAREIAQEASDRQAEVEETLNEIEASVEAEPETEEPEAPEPDTDVPEDAGPVEPEEATEEDEAPPEPATAIPSDVGLTDIPGVGKAKAQALDEAGYDVAGIAEAGEDDLSEVPGIGAKLAEKIKRAVREIQEDEV